MTKIVFSPIIDKSPWLKRAFHRFAKNRTDELSDSSQDLPLTIIVRNRNEAPLLHRILQSIASQEYSSEVQIIVVDTESRDDSLLVAKEFGADILEVKQSDFSYSGSLNDAFKLSKHELVIITVAHALPANNVWLRVAARHFHDPKVAGMYSINLIDEMSRVTERLVRYSRLKMWPTQPSSSAKIRPGLLGATNCAIRRSLWALHPFDERYEAGGEDTAWAKWALAQGYTIFRDPLFAVHHTHGLKLHENIVQLGHYIKMFKGPQSKNSVSKYAKRRYN